MSPNCPVLKKATKTLEFFLKREKIPQLNFEAVDTGAVCLNPDGGATLDSPHELDSADDSGGWPWPMA
jgi:hypothetical protein